MENTWFNKRVNQFGILAFTESHIWVSHCSFFFSFLIENFDNLNNYFSFFVHFAFFSFFFGLVFIFVNESRMNLCPERIQIQNMYKNQKIKHHKNSFSFTTIKKSFHFGFITLLGYLLLFTMLCSLIWMAAVVNLNAIEKCMASSFSFLVCSWKM